MPQLQCWLARPHFWGVMGKKDSCPANPAATLDSWLPTHLQRAACTQRSLQHLKQHCVCQETLIHTAVIRQRGRYLENYTAERATSDTRRKIWHLLPYGKNKKAPCDFGFSECCYYDTLGKLLNLLMFWRQTPHEHMVWQTFLDN